MTSHHTSRAGSRRTCGTRATTRAPARANALRTSITCVTDWRYIMYSLSADNWTDIQRDLFALLAHNNNDLRDVQFELTNPLARVSSSKIRGVDYGYAAGKFFWDLDASSDVERLNYYNRRLSEADMLDMADGFYCRNSEYHKSRWDEVVEELTTDPSIGDAVIDTNDLVLFTIRGGRLHMRVTSLHADAIWRL